MIIKLQQEVLWNGPQDGPRHDGRWEEKGEFDRLERAVRFLMELGPLSVMVDGSPALGQPAGTIKLPVLRAEFAQIVSRIRVRFDRVIPHTAPHTVQCEVGSGSSRATYRLCQIVGDDSPIPLGGNTATSAVAQNDDETSEPNSRLEKYVKMAIGAIEAGDSGLAIALLNELLTGNETEEPAIPSA